MQRRNHVLEQMKTRAAASSPGKDHTAAEYDAAKARAADPHARRRRRRGRRRTSSGRSASSSARSCAARRTRRPARRSTPAATRSSRPLDWEMQQTVEKWLYAVDPRDPPQDARRRSGRTLGIPKSEYGWLQQPARREHPQRRGRRHGLPDRPGPRLRRQRRLLPRGHGQEVPAPVRRHVRRASASRDRRSSRSTTSSASTTTR